MNNSKLTFKEFKKNLDTLSDSFVDKRVKIQGSRFDRKRRISDSTIQLIKYMYSLDCPVADIAKILNLNYNTVRYHADAEWRTRFNALRNGKHTGKDTITARNRADYKRLIIQNL